MVRRRVATATGKRLMSAQDAAVSHPVEIGTPVDLGITMSVCRREPTAASRQATDCRNLASDISPTEH